MMDRNPEFSVVVTAYNKGRHIDKAIESVLRQSYQNFEIIIIDDGSTDNTKQIIEAMPDKRIRYFYQDNSGLPACARNKGMALSSGKYIALLDGDDYWHEEKLEKCKKVLDEIQETGLVCHNEAVIYGDKTLRQTSYGPYVKNMHEKLLFEGNCLHPSAVTLRRQIFLDDGFKFSEDENLLGLEDYEYWLRLSEKYKFYFIPDILGYYTVSSEGDALSRIEKNITNMLNFLDLQFIKLNGKNTKKIRKRKSSVMRGAGRMYHHKRDFEMAREWYLKSLREYAFNYKTCLGLVAALFKIRIIYR